MDERNPTESLDVETISSEPTTLADEGADPTIPYESVPETTQESEPETTGETFVDTTEATIIEDPEELEGTQATIYVDLSGSDSEETTAATEEVVIVEVIETVGSDIAHASLFSGFLVSGTLIGIFLLRKVYGT